MLEKFDEEGKNLIISAYEFALSAHNGQRRKSGEEFFVHPLEVAKILSSMDVDAVTIASALLHDVVEDTSVSIEEIEKRFGEEIATLVDGVTKLSKLTGLSGEERQAENLRKMFLAMAKDVRVIFIKLADRLHNMRTLSYLPPERQKTISKETLDIFAPLAHRLGMWRIKWELEDLSFKYLEPEKYKEISRLVAKTRKEREEHIQEAISIIRSNLDSLGIKADIQGRPKHLYSIYTKMQRDNLTFDQIYDLLGIRVIVDSTKDCYTVLGIVHSLWKPIPGRFKDYIAVPKSNMYQSLHTTVIGPRGEPLEIQIRTYEMHRIAEYGIAAHWKYKEGRTDQDFDIKLSWLRQLLEWQKDMQDAKEFVEQVKVDLFEDEVFVFTPKGDVVSLPKGATPVDFAYRIHTEIGNRCVGAKVNGRIVPLDYKLNSGEIVEILTSKSASPSLDWLSFVATTSAKNRIKQYFKRLQREENIARGREILEKELKRIQGDLPDKMKELDWAPLLEAFELKDPEDLFLAVGNGEITPQQILQVLQKTTKEEKILGLPKREESTGVYVDGADNLLIRLARCCSPLPGDEIIGYISQGRGITVHRKECTNVKNLPKEKLIDVRWHADNIHKFNARIDVYARDRVGLLKDILTEVSNLGSNVYDARAVVKNGRVNIYIVLDVQNIHHCEAILRAIRGVRDVISVGRHT
ncbi:bifunctional (p)ppGpp synthetase/guanosine-3',5'-bis(diphosphate) 3'-pyrophosphohydrolase [bacterium]|nr:bifunctional (p)ppGpp synthetase/guanosine-3',5'-bis(diphosphate) 3'-pyrophosphohydrolase [bacterium]